jgi:hypothetical protein
MIFKAVLLSFSLIPFLSLASFPVNEFPDDGDNYDDLFDYAYGIPAEEIESKIVSTGAHIGSSCSAAASATESDYKAARLDTETITYQWNGKTDISNYGGDCIWSIDFTTTTYWSNGTVNKVTYYPSSLLLSENSNTQNVFQCPNSLDPNSKVSAYIGAALYCFEQSDLNTRDSCPDSTQDGAYILPASGGNISPTMCQDKPDGSSCKYQKEDDIYITDFENDCYELNGAPRWDDPLILQPDETDPDCQDIGSGVIACVENPENVCDSQGVCNTGCGSVALGDSTPVFVCISGDTDSDGLADYLDPDIDGDGISNELDLDANGDGLDDATYPDAPSEPVSMAATNDLLADSNALNSGMASDIASIKSELETQNGSGLMPAYSTSIDQGQQNTDVYSTIANSNLVVALNSISNVISVPANATCPAFAFYLPSPIDSNISTQIHCELMPTLSIIITPVMLAIYLFLGFRIFTSA